MIWLNPLALIGAAAIAAPVLIHILVQRRAAPFPFPTLRFLQPTRLAAIRRHRLEDLLLLAVRAAILAAAACALAGPFLVTPARRAGWNDRIARAIVGQGEAARAFQSLDLLHGSGLSRAADAGISVLPSERRSGAAPRETVSAARSGGELSTSENSVAGSAPQPFRVQVFDSGDLRDGIARAVVWLDASPPARREVVVVAPFALGSLTGADLGAVPPEVGIRLVRSGQLPATRSFAVPPVLDSDLASRSVHRLDRVVDLNGPSTSVRVSARVPASVPVEIVAAGDVKRAAEATLAAVLSQRVVAPVSGRFARVVFGSPTAPASGGPSPTSRAVAMPSWIADAIARVTTEPLASSFDSARLAAGATAAGLVSAAAGSDGQTLAVTTSLPPSDLRTARLFRSILGALGAREGQSAPGFAEDFGGTATTSPVAGRPIDGTNPPPTDRGAVASAQRGAQVSAERHPQTFAEQEILAITDAELGAWERPAGDVRSPRLDSIERDDRRWWWAAALALLALEWWLRSARREPAEDTGGVEAARVA